jgi:hypothetical protein
MKSKLLLAVFAAALSLGPVLHADTQAIQLPGSPVLVTTLPAEDSIDKVGSAVVQAAQGRAWTVVSTDQNIVVATLTHRGISAKLFIVIGKGSIQFYSDSWKIDKTTGARISPTVPKGWIKNVEKDTLRLLHRSP